MRYIGAAASAAVVALALPGLSWAHARVSPAVVESKAGQAFTLLVPTEKENAKTTKVELTLPSGFAIDSFVPSPGWKRAVVQHGTGDSAVVEKVAWSGGSVPTDEDAAFTFLATANNNGAYTFGVRQTYSDGSVVDWSGPESSDSPAPTIDAVSALGGGGGGTSTLAIVALVVGVLALIVASVAVFTGGRPLA
ncbi:MAG: DUF1775 domain-containing protein [Actinobacteria bacterium]|nr:MAG: DUF1775 domain-containing protein [Actinomycetota bacterium]